MDEEESRDGGVMVKRKGQKRRKEKSKGNGTEKGKGGQWNHFSRVYILSKQYRQVLFTQFPRVVASFHSAQSSHNPVNIAPCRVHAGCCEFMKLSWGTQFG